MFKSPWKLPSTSPLLPQIEFVLTRARVLSIAKPKKHHGIKVGGSVDIFCRVEPLIVPRMDIEFEILNGAAKIIMFDNIDHEEVD